MSNLSSQANLDQARASDPNVSAWVSANAGSGKTHVLVNRVIRLMLTGTPPEKILCLTYTRAAAAEMSNRLYERLAEWIPLDDDALIDKIHENTGHFRFQKDQLAEPRRLFARALETPGGLKIQTIHAFCEQLLHRFPVEAGVTSGFEVMDDRQAKDLLGKIQFELVNNIQSLNDDALASSLAEIMKFASGKKEFDALLEYLINNRDKFIPVYENLTAASDRLAQELGINPSDTVEQIKASARNELDRPALISAQAILENRPADTDQKQAVILQQLLQSESNQYVYDKLIELTHTKDRKLKSDRSLCTANCAKENPDVLVSLQKESCRIDTLFDQYKAIHVVRATDAALRIGKTITDLYEQEKTRHGFYDYNDLIARVLSMFADMPDAAWVLYKLDGGLDHILIDEAQDTSPSQWAIIQFLAGDFFTGSSARSGVNRSIFAVGDRKQSIYSFMGAAPESFDQQKLYFQNAVRHSEQRFESVDFDVSFRSTTQVLSVVDQVFSQTLAAEGVDTTIHSAHRANAPGIVELWPLEEKSTAEKKSIWVPDDGDTSDDHARIRLAKKIALKIKSWLDSKEILHSENRPIRPGDILILVRKRTQLMAALVRALKQLDIPVAGVDRLKLTRHIGVQDLMTLGRFVLLPQDDLNFAGLLKSSLLARDDEKPFDDDDLLWIAAASKDCSLWDAFNNLAATTSRYSKAKRFLDCWMQRVEQVLPFEFFSSVLSVDNKRQSILNRLGSEASELLDAFLSLAQNYEKTHVPTLQGFLSWIESSDTEIKREMDKSDNEIRVMTVHGAKGLESKIVILPDTYEVPDGKKLPSFFNVNPITPLWRLKSSFDTHLVSDLKKLHLTEANAELNRLLYVALTRACDRLYVGAVEPKKGALKPNSWYQLISNVLCKPEYKTPDVIFGNVWRVSDQQVDQQVDKPKIQASKTAPLPDWVGALPPADKQGENWVAPSRLGVSDKDSKERHLSPLSGISQNTFLRGNLIHKMLQYLPDLPLNQQKETAEQFIANHGHSLSDHERGQTLNEIVTILTDQKFACIFGPGSMAEAPIVARIKTTSGENIVLNGQIDRLYISDNEVLIVDYKTNRPPPASTASVNKQYIRQLAAYRLALLEIYPEHTIRAGLLWTHNAVLMEIEQNRLNAVFSD